MSITAHRNGLVSLLTACGPFAASEISTCDFGIMETVSACAIVIMPGKTSTIEPEALNTPGRYYYRRWQMTGRMYIKYREDVKTMYGLVWQAHDDLYNTISKDDSLQGQAQEAHLNYISHDPDVFANSGGGDWAIVEFQVESQEF